MPGHNWLVGYSSGYGRTTIQNSYLLHIAETISKMTRGRCLFDILAEVHGNLKAMYPEQIPQFHTSFTSAVYLTKVAIIASIKHSGDSLNNIVTWLPVDDNAAKSEPIRQKNSTRSLFQRLRGKK